MNFIDTHTHLYLKDFDADRELMVERAVQNGVNKFLLPNIDSSTLDSMFKMAESTKGAYPMVGLHPGSVKEKLGRRIV